MIKHSKQLFSFILYIHLFSSYLFSQKSIALLVPLWDSISKNLCLLLNIFKSGLIIKADADRSMRLSDRNYLKEIYSPHGELSSSRDDNFWNSVWHQLLMCTVKILNCNRIFFLGSSFTYHQFTDEGCSKMSGQVRTFTMKYLYPQNLITYHLALKRPQS